MTDDPPKGDDAAARRLAMARELYRELSEALRASILRIRDGSDSATEIRARQDLCRQHMKQLQSVLEIEGQLETHGQANPGAIVLDLEAARAEIHDRLARYRDRGGG